MQGPPPERLPHDGALSALRFLAQSPHQLSTIACTATELTDRLKRQQNRVSTITRPSRTAE